MLPWLRRHRAATSILVERDAELWPLRQGPGPIGDVDPLIAAAARLACASAIDIR